MAVIGEFVEHGIPVRALVRSRTHWFDGFPVVELVEGDMVMPETLGPALAGIERALMISTANEEMLDTQCAFIDACKKAGVPHIIKFSGAETGIGFDQMKFRFTRLHQEIEDYLENSGLAWTHLQPGQFMQVYLREARDIAAKGTLSLPLEDVKLAPVDVADIAKISFALLRRGGYESRSFEITGPEALSMAEIAARIAWAIEKPVEYIKITPAERRQSMLAAGMPADLADALDEQTAERLRCPLSRIHLGTHDTFGVTPTTFAEFARRYAGMFKGKSLFV
jgi:uncharacterized protein YbjT (DUF2867 family)